MPTMPRDHLDLLARLRSLSAREREVLQMASRGMTNTQVAGELHVSVHAVKFHLAGVYRKLSVANRTQATMLLYSFGAGQTAGIWPSEVRD